MKSSVFSFATLAAAIALAAVGEVDAGWETIPFGLVQVTASANYLWGVNEHDEIFVCTRPCTSWTKVPGALVQVDADDQEVWGVNGADEIYKRPVDGSGGGWKKVPGLLKHVSASGNGYVWGVNGAQDIWKCKKPCSGAWVKVAGKLKQVDGGEGYVYGVNAAGAVFARPIDGRPPGWRNIPGKLKHITASGQREVFGVDDNDLIWRCKKPCIGDWEHVEGLLVQCDGTYDAVFGVNSAKQIWRRRTGV